jgi:hypothetical protein
MDQGSTQPKGEQLRLIHFVGRIARSSLAPVFSCEQRHQSWDSVDIELLDLQSLMTWLRSRGGNNEWAENTVALLLGHSLENQGGPVQITKEGAPMDEFTEFEFIPRPCVFSM